MKKRSVLGIIISIIMSIILVPFIWVFGISGTSLMTVSSVVKEERKDEIFDVFMENEGGVWIHGMIEPMIQEMVAEYAGQYEGFDTTGLLTVEDVERIATEFYAKAVNGEIYELDATFIADRIKPQLDGIIDAEIDKQIDAQADAEIEKYIDENLETVYESLPDDVKAQIKAEVKPIVLEEGKKVFLEEVEKEFDAQIDAVVEAEVDKYIAENYPDVPANLVAAEKEKYLAENKDRIVAEAKAETMAEAEKQYDAEAGAKFDAEADAYIQENIREIYAQIDAETKAELIATAKEEILPQFKEEYKAQYKQQYIDEYSAMIDEAVLSAQTEINATIASVYTSEEYAQLEQTQADYGINIYDFDGLNEIFKSAGYICFGAAAVVILILLLCYLFRPAGFFVAGIFTLILGAGVKVIAGKALPIASEMIHTAVELPHESVNAIVNSALVWVTEGLNESAMIGIFAGAALLLLGILTTIIRRGKTA